MSNNDYTSGMNDTYVNNSQAQSICHLEAREMIIESVENYLNNYNGTEFVIGVFGCGPGDNDLICIKNYILPLLVNKLTKIKIYMIDISENKWSRKKLVIDNELEIHGLESDIYKNIFPDNTFDMILSFSCLHWIKNLPFDYHEIANNYSWSSLDKEQKIKLNSYMNDSLKLFLYHRKKELKENGIGVLTFDAIIDNELHQYQGPTDILVRGINQLDNDKIKLFDNFFVPTAPRYLNDVNDLLSNNFKTTDLLIKNIKCPIWENKIKQIYNNDEYAKLIIDSIMSCVLPLMKDTIQINNFDDLINEIENKMISIIKTDLNIKTSTSGNVMFLCLTK